MNKITITLLWGLPGSGKSYYAQELQNNKNHKRDINVIDCDKLWKQHERYGSYERSLYDLIADEVARNNHYYRNVIIDGLVTTNKVADEIFTAIATHPESKDFDIKFNIVCWEKDIETCLYNDLNRRIKSSKGTIENTKYETPNEKLLKDWNVELVMKKVVKKPEWKAWSQKVGLGDNSTLESNEWCLGGEIGNCWNNNREIVSPSKQPASFQEFDDFLTELCPSLSFLQYKKLYNYCVSIKEEREGLYYGGYTSSAKYVCDLPKLYEMLTEIGVVEVCK